MPLFRLKMGFLGGRRVVAMQERIFFSLAEMFFSSATINLSAARMFFSQAIINIA
jgi:hypothetical protein